MKVAFFGDAKYIGAYEWIRFLAAQEDFEVHAIVFPGHEREIPGVRLHVLRGRLPGGKLRYFLCVPALKRVLREISPDLLIAYRVVSYGLAAGLSGFHPLVMAAQGMFIASRATPRFSRAFARRALKSADLLHAWAPIMTENMLRLGANPDRILTLTRGVDAARFIPGPTPPPPLTLITTRQLERYYNFPTLIEAVGAVKHALGGVRYWIAGEGSARAELESLVEQKGLTGEIEFLGSVDRDRLPGILKQCHLYVAAVPSDGTSASMLEAMAAGVVPIVSDNESNRHWVTDGDGGRLVQAFDAAGYAAAILEAWRSTDWRESARIRNRALIEEKASWSRNMAVFVKAYRELAAGRAPIPTLEKVPRAGHSLP